MTDTTEQIVEPEDGRLPAAPGSRPTDEAVAAPSSPKASIPSAGDDRYNTDVETGHFAGVQGLLPNRNTVITVSEAVGEDAHPISPATLLAIQRALILIENAEFADTVGISVEAVIEGLRDVLAYRDTAASGIEARRAATENTGAVHESAARRETPLPDPPSSMEKEA